MIADVNFEFYLVLKTNNPMSISKVLIIIRSNQIQCINAYADNYNSLETLSQASFSFMDDKIGFVYI